MAYQLRLDWLPQNPLAGTDLNIPFWGPAFMVLEGTTQASKVRSWSKSHTAEMPPNHLHPAGNITLRKQQRHENVTIKENACKPLVLVSGYGGGCYGGGPPVTVKPARSLTAFYTFVLDPRTSIVLFILSQDASVCIRQKQLRKTTTNPNVEL